MIPATLWTAIVTLGIGFFYFYTAFRVGNLRALLFLSLFLAGCASQSPTPQTASVPGRIETTDAGRLAIAKNLNLKLVDQDGQQLFCRSNFVTASRIRRDTTCYTADELEKLEAQMQHDLDQFELRSSVGGIHTP
jgi:hypothetical protein